MGGLGELRGMYECATVAYIHVTDVLRCSAQLDSPRLGFGSVFYLFA